MMMASTNMLMVSTIPRSVWIDVSLRFRRRNVRAWLLLLRKIAMDATIWPGRSGTLGGGIMILLVAAIIRPAGDDCWRAVLFCPWIYHVHLHIAVLVFIFVLYTFWISEKELVGSSWLSAYCYRRGTSRFLGKKGRADERISGVRIEKIQSWNTSSCNQDGHWIFLFSVFV
jgi:hypothetical protein